MGIHLALHVCASVSPQSPSFVAGVKHALTLVIVAGLGGAGRLGVAETADRVNVEVASVTGPALSRGGLHGIFAALVAPAEGMRVRFGTVAGIGLR